ncbi:hypothetical protein GGR28_003168 [Lewinella aquimaris]|uniref:Uncharacterized protein n=1 Tax=Neolewinella aquimaris TaxID=1835722 RepID=A0A840E4I0_9BACT|nr:hypothetical protein [Neolewinella aquimaris]
MYHVPLAWMLTTFVRRVSKVEALYAERVVVVVVVG